MLVLGAEDKGVNFQLQRACTYTTSITGSVDKPFCIDSINVASAGAILLHELTRFGARPRGPAERD